MAKQKNLLPSSLAYARGIDLTDGIMSGVEPRQGFKGIESIGDAKSYSMSPVLIDTTTIRGTIANYDAKPPADRVGMDSKSINTANIARIEQALLPSNARCLHVEFVARFNDNGTHPEMHNSSEFVAQVKTFTDAYAAKGGYAELALRYFLRIANGSWLWRNRYGDSMQVRVAMGEESIVFNDGDIDLSSGVYSMAAVAKDKAAGVALMVDQIAKALAGQSRHATLKCSGLLDMGPGAEVYPSQEFSSDSTVSVVGGEKPTKILSKIQDTQGRYVATIHARKIGNAIRTIDTWHGVEGVGPIAVEMFGANTHQAVAHRLGKGLTDKDFYTLFQDVEALGKEIIAGGVSGNHHFVAACLIRGGVFGFGSSK